MGQYHSISDKYLPKYLDEFMFKYNNRVHDDLLAVSSSWPPLTNGGLNDLCEDIYKEQFFDHDITIDNKNMLTELQNLNKNPKLLDYVIKCLSKEKILTTTKKICIIINKEYRKPYNEKFWKKINKDNPFEEYKKTCIDDDFDLQKEDILFPKVFDSIADIEDFCLNKDNVKKEIPFWSTHKDNENIKFEKYTIHEIGI
jgi:hypothetical protein